MIQNDADKRLPHSTTPALDLRLLREYAAGDEAAFERYVARRAAGEPVAQIIGSKGFWTLELEVSRDVLTPRPDSETILDALLQLRPNKDSALRILDLGTGSGCLILAALSEYKNATGDAVDVSEAALAVAMRNAERLESRIESRESSNNVIARSECDVAIQMPVQMEEDAGLLRYARNDREKNRLEFYHGSWCDALPEGRKYDVILTNPPYIPTDEIEMLDEGVKYFEPHLALDGGKDGFTCYRMLAKQIHMRMVEKGIALIEVGAGQAHEVAAIMKQSGMTVLNIKNDLAGIARVVVCEKPAVTTLERTI